MPKRPRESSRGRNLLKKATLRQAALLTAANFSLCQILLGELLFEGFIFLPRQGFLLWNMIILKGNFVCPWCLTFRLKNVRIS